MADTYVVYQGSDDWDALYVNGKLVTVGDGYLIDERLREIFGVETISSDGFLLGNRNANYGDVAKTVEEIEAFERTEVESATQKEVERLRTEAQVLLEKAAELDNK